MPNPQVIICHSFKHHTAISMTPFVYTLPSKRTVLPCPVHAIDASKHFRKSSGSILCHDPCSLFLSWPSQVVFAKLSHHSSAKLVHALNGSRLTHAKVVVLCIGRCSICKHPHGCGALLNGREPENAYIVDLELEVGVELSNAVEDIHEQALAHPV